MLITEETKAAICLNNLTCLSAETDFSLFVSYLYIDSAFKAVLLCLSASGYVDHLTSSICSDLFRGV